MLGDKKIALSFDTELWNETEWLKPYTTEEMLKNDPFPESIEKILNLLKKYKSKATFFITLEVTKKYPEILKEISDNGHEIGVHGPKHKKLKDYNPRDFKKDCIEQITLIETITAKKPLGYRAPHFSLNKETFWVLEILKELGFKYDSSLFPINLGEYGISNAKTSPYEIIPGLKEIPISVAEFGKIRIPFAGGIYFRILPFWVFKFFIDHTSKTRQVNLYFHPHELDTSTPKIKTGPWLRIKLKYWGVNRNLNKFEKLLKKYTTRNILIDNMSK